LELNGSLGALAHPALWDALLRDHAVLCGVVDALIAARAGGVGAASAAKSSLVTEGDAGGARATKIALAVGVVVTGKAQGLRSVNAQEGHICPAQVQTLADKALGAVNDARLGADVAPP